MDGFTGTGGPVAEVFAPVGGSTAAYARPAVGYRQLSPPRGRTGGVWYTVLRVAGWGTLAGLVLLGAVLGVVLAMAQGFATAAVVALGIGFALAGGALGTFIVAGGMLLSAMARDISAIRHDCGQLKKGK